MDLYSEFIWLKNNITELLINLTDDIIILFQLFNRYGNVIICNHKSSN